MQNELNKTGFLQVRATTASRAIPISDASVVITTHKNQGQTSQVLYSSSTDESGITPVFVLPAPPKALSNRPSDIAPFAEYDIEVSKKNFITQIHRGVKVFADTTTIQPIDLEPAPINATNIMPQIF